MRGAVVSNAKEVFVIVAVTSPAAVRSTSDDQSLLPDRQAAYDSHEVLQERDKINELLQNEDISG
jgi:hypothetical protein